MQTTFATLQTTPQKDVWLKMPNRLSQAVGSYKLIHNPELLTQLNRKYSDLLLFLRHAKFLLNCYKGTYHT